MVLCHDCEPVPVFVTVRVCWMGEKIAVTEIGLLIVTSHSFGAGSVSQPTHSVSSDPGAGVAFSVILVPSAYSCEQVGVHSIPVGVLLTVPEPEPFSATDRG